MILSHNGLNFTSKVSLSFPSFIATVMLSIHLNTQKKNDAAKRANGTLMSILRNMSSFDPLHWSRFLDSTLLVYCISYRRFVGLSPFKVLYGRDPKILYSNLAIFNLARPDSAKAGMHLIANNFF